MSLREKAEKIAWQEIPDSEMVGFVRGYERGYREAIEAAARRAERPIKCRNEWDEPVLTFRDLSREIRKLAED